MTTTADRITSLLLSAFLIATFSLSAGAETVARPFPQHTVYAAGSIRPSNLTISDLDRETAAFYAVWKARRLKAAGQDLYVDFTGEDNKADRDTISVSEGHGYGMLITALMAGHDPNARAQFDALYRFFKSRPSINNPLLMSWRQNRRDAKNEDSASDGDLDIAYALLLADRQWGSQGGIDYQAEAKRLLGAIMSAEINPQIWSVKLGDSISSDDAEFYDTRSSDLMPSHFRAFAKGTGVREWNAVTEKTFAVIEAMQSTHSPETGLLPDFICHLDKKPTPAKAKYLESKHDGAYYYNACRVPFRVGVDFLIGGEPRSQIAVRKINRWMREKTGGDPAKIAAGYTLSGKEIDHESQMCFVAPLAVSAMVDAENQEWLNALTSYVIHSSKEDTGYYDSTIKLLCLIVLSGNWWTP